MNKNNKIPMAILSCFLIAFVLQGILKICGVFVFEKALSWEIFNIIDNNYIIQIIYYILLNLITIYCLSFALTPKPYSKKWYVYLIIFIGSTSVILSRMLIKTPMFMEFVYDTILYVIVPVIVTAIENKKTSLNLIPYIAIQIMLYFCYLGLGYWSGLVCSLHPQYQLVLGSSKMFLINIEIYIALVSMLFIPKKNKY